MTTLIKNLFTNKADYNTFRSAWSAASNHPNAKSKLVTSVQQGKHREKGWITASHQLLFNLLCGKPEISGFTPVTNPTKLANGALPNAAFDEADRKLSFNVLPIIHKKTGKVVLNKYDRLEYINKHVDGFLKPFITVNSDESFKQMLIVALNSIGDKK